MPGVFNSSVDGSEGRGDYFLLDLATTPSVQANYGTGDDVVEVTDTSSTTNQVRLTFTSAQVGNGNPNDSNTMANQDGGLAVRLQREDGSGNLTGAVSRFDDEGISFISSGAIRFDVRDLVSGVGRGQDFEVVRLGTSGGDLFRESATSARDTYINAGMGDDIIETARGNDFLVGGAGNDRLSGREGNDSFIGGAGDDQIFGGVGNDTIIHNVSTDGADRVDAGGGSDTVNISAASGVTQVRLTFTSAQVGDNIATDNGGLANQDGGLAVRLQAEDASGALTGPVSRFDDEGITFVATTPGVTFDVRDLVSGVSRGNGFQVAALGTRSPDVFDFTGLGSSYYVNAGGGNDIVTGGTANDFLVGGAGNDRLDGREGNDSFIGGAGSDQIFGGDGNDTIIHNVSTDGADRVDAGGGSDTVNVSAGAGVTQVRLTFTSAQVGDNIATDNGGLANQDGGLAVRLQAEDGSGALTGLVSRFDDEGITFVATTPGVTFDVRDLVSGVARGDGFQVAALGTRSPDVFDFTGLGSSYYVNAGGGNDTVTGGTANDFLVGGAGNDRLDGREGNDSFIGGAGGDTFVFSVAAGADRILDFVSLTDKIDLRAFDVDFGDVTITAAPGGTVIGVDVDGDAAADFTITLTNNATPVERDFLFASQPDQTIL